MYIGRYSHPTSQSRGGVLSSHVHRDIPPLSHHTNLLTLSHMPCTLHSTTTHSTRQPHQSPGSHVAALSTPPALQLDAPEATKPWLHTGWHVEPDARLDVQSPTAPCAGAADASHTTAKEALQINSDSQSSDTLILHHNAQSHTHGPD